MSAVTIKLSEPTGLTRRVSFRTTPNWEALASRIAALYKIPVESVSVSYLDLDNDQVTLSSQEELDDYYASFYKAGDIIKFTVQDLTSARLSRSHSQAQSPRSPNIRNTFGIGAFDIDDDWQIPLQPTSGLGGIYMSDSSSGSQPHAFVETVASDASTITDHQEGIRNRVNRVPSVHSVPESPLFVPLDKGKAKAFVDDDDISSTGSVLAEDAPPKPPVHVYDLSSREHDDAAQPRPNHATEAEALLGPSDGLTDSTPKTQTFGTGADAAEVTGSAPDPPLPSLEFASTSQHPSLANDLAVLFGALSNVVSVHPELSEGIHNITRNAASGAYWRSHREAMSRTAHEIAQETGRTANSLREAEAEAGRRIAEAISNMFGTVHQSFNSANADAHQEGDSTPSVDPAVELGTGGVDATNNASPKVSRDKDIPPRPSQHEHSDPGAWMRMPWGRLGQRLPPPFPFGPPRGPHDHRHNPFVPPMPPPAMPPPPAMHTWHEWLSPGVGVRPPPGPRPDPYNVQPPTTSFPPANPSNSSPPTLQDLRSQVEEAKAQYKAYKERYRSGREDHRKQRGLATTVESTLAPEPIVPPSPVVSPIIAVVDENGSPTHEVVNVRRHHTHLGHSHTRRHGSDHGGLKLRTINRITKRLADMGFTEGAYPDLSSRIRAQLPVDGSVLGNDQEDNIVTTLLEELLALSPKPPVASGSGLDKGKRFSYQRQ